MKNKTKNTIIKILALIAIIISSILIYSFAAVEQNKSTLGPPIEAGSETKVKGDIGVNGIPAYSLNGNKYSKDSDTFTNVADMEFTEQGIKIVGKDDIIPYENNEALAAFAWVGSQEHEYTNYAIDKYGNNIISGNASTLQAVIWYYAKDFVKTVAPKTGVVAEKWSQIKDYSKIINQAKAKGLQDYIKKIGKQETKNPEFSTADGKDVKFEVKGRQIIIGALKIKSPSVNSIEVYNKNGQKLNVKIGSYEGKELKEVNTEYIKDGKEFYLVINIDENSNVLTSGDYKIIAKANAESIFANQIRAKIWKNNLRIGTAIQQDQITFEKGNAAVGEEKQLELSGKFDLGDKKITIKQYGINNNGKVDTGMLGGAKFRILNKTTQKYLQLPKAYREAKMAGKDADSGEYGYNPETGVMTLDGSVVPLTSKNDASILFETKEGKELIIEGLEIGEYEIEEVEAPEGYELAVNGDNNTNIHHFNIPFEANDTKERHFHSKVKQAITISRYSSKDGDVHKADTEKGKLGGAVYVIYNNNTHKYVKSAGTYNASTGEYIIKRECFIDEKDVNKTNMLSNRDILFETQTGKSLQIVGLDLESGRYSMEEVKAPEGYELAANGEENNKKLAVADIPGNLGSHYDFIGNPLGKNEVENSIEIRKFGIDGNGNKNTGMLGGSKYIISKTDNSASVQIPRSYLLSDGKEGYDPETGTYTLDYYQPGRATFDSVIQFETREGKPIILKGLQAGDYYIEEVKTTDGYEAAIETKATFSIPLKEGDSGIREFYSVRKQVITINKYASKNGNIHESDLEKGLLGGAKFTVYNENEKQYVKSTANYNKDTNEYEITENDFVSEEEIDKTNILSNKDIIFTSETGRSINLKGLETKAGKYILEEVEAPEGYGLTGNGEGPNNRQMVTKIPDNLGSHYDFINECTVNTVENSIEIKDFEIDNNGKISNSLLNGAKFIIYNKTTNQSVQIPRSYLNSDGKEGYDPETGTYTLDYYQPGRAAFDKVIHFETRDGKPIILKGLQAGEYEIEQIKAPDGYELSENTKATFSIPMKQGDTAVRNFYNKHSSIITINKYASKDGNIHEADTSKGLLGGAKFTVYNSDTKEYVKNSKYNKDTNEYEITKEEFVKEEDVDVSNILSNKDIIFTSEAGKSINLRGLETKAGKYILEEVEAPEGYGLTGNGEGPNNRQMITKIPDNLGSHYDFINECTVNTVENSIEIRNLEIDNNGKVSDSLLNGAKFIIYNKTTNQSVQIPRSYLNSDGKEGYDPETGTYTLDYYQPGRSTTDKVINFETRDGKPIILKGLQAGEYEIEQMKAPDGYELSENTKATFSIPMKQGDTAVRNFYNKRDAKAITINKYAAKNGNAHEADTSKGLLGGAVFTIYNTDTKKYVKSADNYNNKTGKYELEEDDFIEESKANKDDILSNKDILFTSEKGKGIILNGLEKEEGNYIVEEVKAPEGYGLSENGNENNKKQMSVKVPDDLGSHYDFINECNVNERPNSIEIRKYGKDNNGNRDTDLLGGAEFRIFEKKTRQYVQLPREYLKARTEGKDYESGEYGYNPETGVYTYSHMQPETSKNSDVVRFKTKPGLPLIIEGLPEGEYEIEEVKAPDGYELSENTKATFSIPKAAEDTAVRTFYNTHRQVITINKYEAKNGEIHEADTSKGLLGGAKYTVFNKDKKQYVMSKDNYNSETGEYEVDKDDYIKQSKINKKDILSNEDIIFTSEKDKSVVIKGLEAKEGTYIIEEVGAPEGYEISKNGDPDNENQMTVKIPDNLGSHYDFINRTLEDAKKAEEEQKKEDENKDKEDENKEDNENEEEQNKIDEDKEWEKESEEVKQHSIRIRKYGIDSKGVKGTEKLGGAKFRIYNKKEEKYVKLPEAYIKAKYEGKDISTGEFGYDPKLGVYTLDDNQLTDSTDNEMVLFETESGKSAIIKGLKEGEYEIEEIVAPEDYELPVKTEKDKGTQSVNIPLGEDSGIRNFYNKQMQIIKINKYAASDSNEGEADKEYGVLKGAKFVIRYISKDGKQKEYVKIPDESLQNPGVDTNSYNSETGTYTIGEHDYYPEELAYDKTNGVYDEEVQFTSEREKSIALKGLKEGNYEIEEIIPPDGYELSEDNKKTFSIPNDYGTQYDFIDKARAGTEYEITIEKYGYEVQESWTPEGTDLWFNAGGDWSINTPAPTPNAVKEKEMGSLYGVYRVTTVDPETLVEKAKEVHKHFEYAGWIWGYSPYATVEEAVAAGWKQTNCSTYIDWVLKEVGSGLPSLWCPTLADVGQLLERTPGFEKIPLEEMKAGDLALWHGHIQMYAGKAGVTETTKKHEGELLGGTQFVIRNTDTREYVQLPKKYLAAQKAEREIQTEDGYDVESGRYYINGADYIPYDEAYNEATKTYKSTVKFISEEGKPIILKGLKEGHYEVEEIDPPIGYELSDENTLTISIPEDNGGKLEFNNKQVAEGTFRKVIKGTDVPLKGFEFKLIEHKIDEEYGDEINKANFPETYQGIDTAKDQYIQCELYDTIVYQPNVGFRCMHGQSADHARIFNEERARYNTAVMKANRYHSRRHDCIEEANARGLVSDEDGYVDFKPLSTCIDDKKGIVDMMEISVGSNPYFNLKDDEGKDRIEEGINYHGENKMENERKRMDIEGLIWEDLGHKKSPEWNALFDEGSEELLHPIEVSLKVDGEEIAKGVVTGDGKYRIRVGVDELKGEFDRLKRAYIEFTYNGIVYQNVDVHLEEALGSKAAENAENRNNLINNPYTNIRANNGVTSLSDKGDIKYWRPPDEHTEEYKSKTRYEGNVSGDLTCDEITSEPIGDGQYTVSKIPKIEYDQVRENEEDTGFAENCYYKTNKTTQEKYQMTATTKEAGFEEFENYTIDKDRIENVNLGLYYREQPDVSVENDIYQVRVEYDGHKYTYQYGKKSTDNSSKGNLVYEENSDVPNYQGGAFDAQVKFQDNRKYTYRREIYPSDIEIIPNSGQEINIFVTYRTEIFNESTTLTVRPTELVSQYGSRYIGYIDENGTLQDVPRDVTANFAGVEGQEAANGISVTWSREGYGSPQQADGYQQAYGRIDTFIPPEESRLMFTEYRLAREQCIDLINGANSIPLYNHIEMNAYTTQKEGQNYGGIDKDSHPGNMTPGNEVTYEDDNDEAPLFELVRPEKNNGNRILEGNVFEDVPELKEENGKESIPDANIGRDNIKERKANGTKEDGKDNPIQNVQVELIEVDWDESKNSWVDSGRIAKLDISKKDTDRTDSDEYTNSLQTSVKSEEFEMNKDNLQNASTTTDENGNYSFHGFASGRYLLRYTWGQGENLKSVIKDGNTTNVNGTDIEGTPIYVQQYKSTVFGDLEKGKERYKKYTEYQQDSNKPQRWYLHATNPDISSGEYRENGPDEYAHTNLSSAIDEITSTANSDPNDGSGQRTKIDGQMKKINNVNNYKDYTYTTSTTSTSAATPDFWGDVTDPNSFNGYRANQEMQKMYSRTISFDIGLENLWEDNDSTTYIKDGNEDHREFKITGMDFGITERPNINLQIKKQIENVRIVLANGQILVDADIDENGNVSGPAINTKYLKPTKKETYSDIGVLHTEMDTELMHGAVIQITYKYTIHNTSELDYVLETADYGEATIRQDNNSTLNDYYKFGIYEGEDKEVTTRATKVVDYLDNKINFDETLENDTANHPYGKDNQVWLRDEIQTKDGKGIYDKHEVFSDIKTFENSTDIVDRIKKGYLTLTRGEQIPASEESTATEEQRKRESDNGNPLKAEEETVFRLTASKDLSSTNQDTSYFNSAEIIKLDKTGGEYPGELPRSVISVSESGERSDLTKKIPSTTPANFDPTESTVSTQVHSTNIPDEPDSWTAEQVTVTPPTGDYSNYLQVGWTIIAATSLGVLSFGITVIRNVAIKRKKIK